MRAERRHHEARVKAKFRRVARDFWSAGVPRKKREEFIAWQSVRRAHHPKHFCQACKGERYRESRHLQKIETAP